MNDLQKFLVAFASLLEEHEIRFLTESDDSRYCVDVDSTYSYVRFMSDDKIHTIDTSGRLWTGVHLRNDLSKIEKEA